MKGTLESEHSIEGERTFVPPLLNAHFPQNAPREFLRTLVWQSSAIPLITLSYSMQKNERFASFKSSDKSIPFGSLLSRILRKEVIP